MNTAEETMSYDFKSHSNLRRWKGVTVREILDHKTGFITVPVIIGALWVLFVLASILIGKFNIGGLEMEGANGVHFGLDDGGMHRMQGMFQDVIREKMPEVAAAIMFSLGLPILIVAPFAVVFSLLGALYDDRKDRSYLFWKSMPVTDVEEVLLKAFALLIAGPVILLGIAWAVQVILMAAVSLYIAVMSEVGFFDIFALKAVIGTPLSLVTTHLGYIIQALPVFAWLLLVSASAPKMPILFAFLPPVVISVGENLLFNTRYFADWVTGMLSMELDFAEGGMRTVRDESGRIIEHSTDIDFYGVTDALAYFGSVITTPSVLVGLGVAALFIAGAIWQRRYNV